MVGKEVTGSRLGIIGMGRFSKPGVRSRRELVVLVMSGRHYAIGQLNS